MCHVYLSPQLYLELSVLIAVLVSLLVIVRRRVYSEQGMISILANQAYLDTDKGRYRVDFERFNSWRLLAQLTLLEPPTVTPAATWRTYLSFRYWLKHLKLALFEPTYLSVYHTMLHQDDYDYLRSFSAYQCHVHKANSE